MRTGKNLQNMYHFKPNKDLYYKKIKELTKKTNYDFSQLPFKNKKTNSLDIDP